jgi:hypothetical protein
VSLYALALCVEPHLAGTDAVIFVFRNNTSVFLHFTTLNSRGQEGYFNADKKKDNPIAGCPKGQSATKSTPAGWVKSPAALKLPFGQ